MLKLLPGIHKFKTEIHEQNEAFFENLSKGQAPETLFITCSDSRVVPNLITSTAPGELFVVRNAGNIVPRHQKPAGGEEATIEYAVTALGVKHIIVCGHSQCGAMKGLLCPEILEPLPSVKEWLEHSHKTREIIESSYSHLGEEEKQNIAIQENVLVQIENLKTHPCISKKLWKREIHIYGWIYEIESGEVYVHDPVDETFKPFAHVDGDFQMVDQKSLPR